jgi:hypothetical protein
MWRLTLLYCSYRFCALSAASARIYRSVKFPPPSEKRSVCQDLAPVSSLWAQAWLFKLLLHQLYLDLPALVFTIPTCRQRPDW